MLRHGTRRGSSYSLVRREEKNNPSHEDSSQHNDGGAQHSELDRIAKDIRSKRRVDSATMRRVIVELCEVEPEFSSSRQLELASKLLD